MKKIFVGMALIVVMCAFSLVCMCGERDTVAIDGDFVRGSDFIHGMALVYNESASAIIDTYGKYIFEFDSRDKVICSNGLIKILGENEKFAFFSRYGIQLTDYVYDAYFKENVKLEERTLYIPYEGGDGQSDLIPVSRDGKYGYINSEAKEVIPLQFEYAYGFSDGIARICSKGVLSSYGTYTECKYGYIKENGEILKAPDTYWVADDYDSGFAKVDYSVIDVNGNLVDFDGYEAVSWDGWFFVVSDNENGMTAVMDINKNILIPFDTAHKEIRNGYFIVNGDCIKNYDNEIIYSAPDGTKLVGKGLNGSFVRIDKSDADNPYFFKYGLMDTEANVILPAIYDSVYDMGSGVIYCRDEKSNYLCDYNGNIICELNGNNVGTRFSDGLATYTDFDSMKTVYMRNPVYYPEVYYKGKAVESDVPAEIRNNRTLLPMRAVFETLGADIEWDGDNRVVTAVKGENTIVVTIDSDVMYKNGEAIQLDVAALIEHDRTLIPLRAVAEALECEVIWNEISHTVYIEEPGDSAQDMMFKEYTDSTIYRICEYLPTQYGRVLYYYINSPHGAAPSMKLIDNDGNEHSLYNETVPAVSPFKYAELSSVILDADGKTLRYTAVVDKPYIFDGDIITKAGVYKFEANLETAECRQTEFISFSSDDNSADVQKQNTDVEVNDNVSLRLVSESGDEILNNSHIKSATSTQHLGAYGVMLELTDEGRTLFADATEKLIGQEIGMYVDDSLITAPIVNEKIDSSTIFIDGSFTAESAQALAESVNLSLE